MVYRFTASLTALAVAVPAAGQSVIDRVDLGRIERENLPSPPKEPRSETTLGNATTERASQVSGSAIDVGAIVLQGLDGLSPADFSDILARYIGRSLSPPELTRLSEEIGARLRGKGYVFGTTWIAPQKLTAGVLTVQVDPGVIDEVRLEGDESAAVRDTLAPLVGKPARIDEVERRLLLAGDISAVRIRRSHFIREKQRGVLVVTIAETRTRVRAVLENDSTAPIGPHQLRVDADLNAVFASSDAFTVTWVSTPFQPSELQYVRGRYATRIGHDGAEVALSASISATHPGDYLKAFDLDGRSWSTSVSILQPLHRRRDASLWLGGTLELRDAEQWRAGLLRRHDRLFALRVSLYGNAQTAGGVLRGGLTLSRGLDAFGATRAGDPWASRDDSDGTYTMVLGNASWTRPLADGFSLRLAGQAQLSDQPLLVYEEIGLGGSNFLRGYDYSERSGDQGYMGSIELRYDWRNPLGLGRKAQLYGYLDGGRVSNLARGFGGGALASGGGGVRADVSSSIDANLEMAVPLTEPRYETGNHEPRVVFRVLKVF